MARLYDPSQGSVSYGEVDLRQATLASLRQRIVVVPQEGFLFNGTIRDNVRLARVTASDAEVEAALSRLGILDHFERLPEGLDTEVRERGSRLSAGERQLVALGRAALVDPAVLVLDEATSNLDPGTEAEVEAALERADASWRASPDADQPRHTTRFPAMGHTVEPSTWRACSCPHQSDPPTRCVHRQPRPVRPTATPAACQLDR
ncbi:MAG: ATP-binding cassette domain-containing protein [Acidimicrobiia bacterium]|nr:ATP-binding cassette domain-containing protein [Acidimicrobiia bacterium]